MNNRKRKLDDWLSTYMTAVANTEPPRNYHLWTAISCLAGAVQRKCMINIGTLTFYPNMYIILVGPPGKTRKGTAMNIGERFLLNLGVPISGDAITREALVEALEESRATFTTKDGDKVPHSSLSVISPEFTVFLGHENITLLDNLTDWYDCRERFEYRTKTQGVNIVPNVWFNILGATTPEMLRMALPQHLISGGFASRVIFIYEDRKFQSVPFPFLSEEERELMKLLAEDLAHINTINGNFTVTEEFLQDYSTWYKELEANPPFTDPIFDGYLGRRQVHLIKLSMLCSLSRSDSLELTHDDFTRADIFLRGAEIGMPKAFLGVGRSSNADTIAKLMVEISEKKETTFGELMKKFYLDTDQQTLEKMLQTLEVMKFCTFKRGLNMDKAEVRLIDENPG